ncbi:PAS domain-containing protein [uncultured Lutibacter sp.]|uniref:PAS domain-containing protein n=1 Tax=uncultured Lutibacter sp. TaxID=437739 RepID=UPI00262D99F2|nr:PAS domain-containing protein [uncultured Lutibacter sp.]
MSLFFNYATPIIYGLSVLLWAYIFIFCSKKIKVVNKSDKLLKVILIILAIDAFRSFFESVYFGASFTSFYGLIPIEIYEFLSQPNIVIFPKLFNLLTAILILILLITKWISTDKSSKISVEDFIQKQSFEHKKLLSAVEQSANTIVITDILGKIEYTNPKFTEVTGYRAEEVLGKNPRILNSGIQPKEFYVEMWETISNGKVWKGEFQNKKKDGKLFWEQTTISPIKDNQGTIINYLAVKENITALKESEKELKLAQEIAQIGNFNLDLKTNLFTSSNSFDKIVGIQSHHIKSFKTWRTITHPDDTPKNQRELEKCIKYGEKFNLEYRILTKDTQELKWINGAGEIIYENKVPVNFIGTIQDITFQKKNELEMFEAKEKAEKSEKLLLLSQSVAKLGHYVFNIQTGEWNNSAELNSIFGINEDHKRTVESWLEIVHPDFRNEMKEYILIHVIKNKNHFNKHYKIINQKTGSELWVHGLGSLKFNNENEPIEMFGTIQDITIQKENEEELIKVKQLAEESNNLKTEFLNNMSHEIRTPMNGIIGFSDLLNTPDLTTEKRNNYIRIIQSSSKQLLRIIDDILEISRLGTKQVGLIESEVCLNDLLMELFSIFDIKAKQNKTPLYLKKSLTTEQSTILIDKTKLIKILSNLLENALKFTSKGFVELGYKLNNKMLDIYVKDTGVGIDPEKHKVIFERFSQAEKDLSKKVGGLGLGLSIVKENVELIGGSIELTSNKGEGATFTISIPYKPIYPTKIVELNNVESKSSILIVEDEEINYTLLETLLKEILKLDAHFIHAKNGLEAVEIFKNKSNSIDLVFMDLKMPVMNGYEAAKKIKKLSPNLPIIAQTAYTTSVEIKKAKDSGCVDYLTKPIKQDELINVLDKFLKVK